MEKGFSDDVPKLDKIHNGNGNQTQIHKKKSCKRNHGTRVATKTPKKQQKNCIRNEPLTSNYDADSFIIGLTNIERVGIVKWWLEDNLGRVTQHDIRDALYMPQAPYSILSPQHWSQQPSYNHSGASSAWCKSISTSCQLIWDHGKHVKTVEMDKNFNVAKFSSTTGSTKSVVNCLLLEEKIGLLGQESTTPNDCNHILFPIAMVLGDQGHNSSGTGDQAEDIYPHDGNAHYLDRDHSTSSVSDPEGSTNRNVNSESSSTLGREPPHITREENLTDFMRDHPPPIQVIPQEEEDTVVALNDQVELIRCH
eukprot:11145518-Ditylum_brightwellii.AAC.2